jgi:hypothetical protein
MKRQNVYENLENQHGIEVEFYFNTCSSELQPQPIRTYFLTYNVQDDFKVRAQCYKCLSLLPFTD